MHVWDTAGQERFRHIARIYYKDVSAVVLVFDIADDDSFASMEFWLEDLKKYAPEKVIKILVGNKLDKAKPMENRSYNRHESFNNEREVRFEKAMEFGLMN